LKILEVLPEDRRKELCEILDLPEEELENWRDISRKMRVVFHDDGIISQFEGYDRLEGVRLGGVPGKIRRHPAPGPDPGGEDDTPNRYKVSKQADVLMLFYLFSAEELRELFEQLGYPFEYETIPKNIDYYLQAHLPRLHPEPGGALLGAGPKGPGRSWQAVHARPWKATCCDVQGGDDARGHPPRRHGRHGAVFIRKRVIFAKAFESPPFANSYLSLISNSYKIPPNPPLEKGGTRGSFRMGNDPYTFGQIAAANALSDVYAMGGRPLTALNIVCYPSKSVSKETLQAILAGGLDKIHEAGAVLVGGHSVDDIELKYGLSVTGLVHPQRVLTNAGARPGDRLLLTKPLGTGIIATAVKGRIASPDAEAQATAVMTALNRPAAECLEGFAVHAVTDITGFGLLGHALEMAANPETLSSALKSPLISPLS
jgi:hypothetical protein